MNLKNHLIELMEECFKDKEKLFNYKLFEKNELSSSGDFEIPTFKLDGNLKVLQQTIGVLLLSILKEKRYNTVDYVDNKKDFVLSKRYSLENHNIVFTDLCDISLYIGNGWIITVFEVNYHHLLSLFSNDPYKLMLFLYFSVQNAFLDTKILYYDINPDSKNPFFMIFSFISSFTPDNIYYGSYMLENYGICPVDKFNKSLKVKAKPLYLSLEKLNKQRFGSDDKDISKSVSREDKPKRKRNRTNKKEEINTGN